MGAFYSFQRLGRRRYIPFVLFLFSLCYGYPHTLTIAVLALQELQDQKGVHGFQYVMSGAD